jgi:HPt (histidine-containing phosphotransfer) domain-containing protein
MSFDADFAQLAEDLSPEDVRRVLDVFVTDVRRLVGNLDAAAVVGDVMGFRRVAHGLAGAAGAVGAKSLEQACRAAMGRGDLDPSTLPSMAGKIDLLADSALAELAAFVKRLDVPAGRF